MNYPESKQIFERIKSANKILLNCHLAPDPDSVASALSMSYILDNLKKSYDIMCPSDSIPDNVKFLEGWEKIQLNLNYETTDFSPYDLFVFIDSGGYKQIFGLQNTDDISEKVSTDKVINIDHHKDNSVKASVSLVDKDAAAACEVLFLLLEDIEFEIDQKLSQSLLSGIMADTGFFQQVNTTARTLEIASRLVNLGADLTTVTVNINRFNQIGLVQFLGEMLIRLQLDQEHQFVWTATPYDIYKNYALDRSATGFAGNIILRTVIGSNFSIAMVERVPNVITTSFRTRVTGFDVSRIAAELGGGGHNEAAACELEMPFKKAVEKVLSVARKHSNQDVSL